MFVLFVLLNFNLNNNISNRFYINDINNVDEHSLIEPLGDHSWTCNGPYGGQIHALTADSSFIYTGLSLNGVYRRPLGEVGTWEPRRNGIQNATVLSLLSISNDEVYAGLQRGGLRYTTNGGVIWLKKSGIPDSASVNVIFQYSDDTLFVGTEHSGLYRSANGGSSWYSIGGTFGDTANVITFTRDSVNVYLGTDKGIFISSNLGDTWNSLYPGESINKLGWYYGFLYIGTATSGLIYRSPSDDWYDAELEGNISDFALIGDSLYIAVWDEGIFSELIGDPSNFTPKNTGLTNKKISSIEIVDGIIYTGTYGGFFYSPDSANNWYEDNQELNANMIWDIEQNPINQQSVYAVSFGGIYKSNDNGDSWNKYGTVPDTSLFQSIGINPQDSSNIIIGSSSGIYRTTDNGTSWDSAYIGKHLVSNIEIDPINPNRVYATAEDVFLQSYNNGSDWSVSDSGKYYNDIEICYAAPETLYIATNEGIFKSSNYGASLDLLSALPYDSVTRVGIDGNNPSIIYAGLGSSPSSYLYRSIDGGQSWDSTNFTNGPVTGIKTSRNFESHAFVSSMPNGIFLTLDGADNLMDIGPFNYSYPLCLDFSPSSHTVYIGSTSGIYAFTDTSISLLDISAPASFSPDGDSINDDIKFNISASDSNQIYSLNGTIYRDTFPVRNSEELSSEDSIIWYGFNDSGILKENGTYRTEILLTDGFLNIDTVSSLFTLDKAPMISGASGATSNSQGRNVSIDNSGRIHIVYTTFNPEEVFYVNSDDGTNWSEPLDLSNSKNEKSSNPCIAVCHDNTIFVFWEEEYADSHRIAYQRLESGNWLSEPTILRRSSGELKNPNIAVSPNNDLHLVWEEVYYGEILYQKYNNFSETWDTPINISANAGVSRDPYILYHNEPYVFFSDNTSHSENFDIICKYYNGLYWLEEPLNSSTPGNSFSPFAIKDISDQIYLFWSDSTPGNYDIYYKSCDSTSTWSNDTNLTQTAEHSNPPSVSIDESQNVYLFWEEEGEIYRKVHDHQSGWQIKENISNTLTVDSYHPSSSFDCDVVWTEGNSSPYIITYLKEKIPDNSPPKFTITAPDTCFIGDSLFIEFSSNEILDTLPDMWLRDTANDSIRFLVTQEQTSHYTGRGFISGVAEGTGTLRISGTDLSDNTTDTTITVWITSKEFTITAPDTCFIGDSLFVDFSVNDSLNGLPNMWLRDNANDSIQFLVIEDSILHYRGRGFISGLTEGIGTIRISGTDLYNNTIDTTTNIWIALKEFTITAPDTCFIGDSLGIEFSVNDSLDAIPVMWLRDNANDSIQFLVIEDSILHYTGRGFVSGLAEGTGAISISGIDLFNNTIDTTFTIQIESQGSLMPEDSCFAFPNPTREEYIRFMFYVNKTANVNIEIFTLSGRKIRNFIDTEYKGGRIYEESMSVSDMGSDIFIFKATATAGDEEEVVIKKFGVLRQ